MEKSPNIEQKSSRSPWLPFLGVLTVLFSAGMVTVAIVTYLDLHELDGMDYGMKMEIKALQDRLEDIRMEHPLPVNNIDIEKSRLKRFQPTSFFDVILKAQESVFEKYCHDTNTTCPTGEQGDQGSHGELGVLGSIGIPGTAGIKGPRGDVGTAGLDGAQGEAGLQGIRGDDGQRGPSGKNGIHGDTGHVGVTGASGPMGIKGTKGPKGDDGLQGRTGLHGDTGPRGSKGERGIQGEQGPIGERGPPGPKGKDVKKLGDGCECLKKPTFRTISYDLTTGSKRSLEEVCVATGNPQPDITIRKISGQSDETREYECLATNPLGTARKYIQI